MKLPEPFANSGHLVLWLLLLVPAMPAQQEKRAGQLSLPEREALAKPQLVHAESISAGVDDLATRALLLYRTAGGWLPLDPSHAVTLYREAFASARKAPVLRPQLEDAILHDLLPLSPHDVLDLLPGAETATKKTMYGVVIDFELTQGDYSLATEAFDRAIAENVLPESPFGLGDPHFRPTWPRGVVLFHLIASLPQGMSADRARIFAAIFQYYKTHPDPHPFEWNLAELIVRFHAQLPRELVVQAVETVLQEAERHPGGGMSGRFGARGENTVRFSSSYDAQLFAVAPILEMLESGRAVSLLAQHGEAAANLKKYPEGLRSLNPVGFSPLGDALGVNRSKPIGLQLYNTAELAHNVSTADMGLEFTIPRDLNTPGGTGSVVFFPDPNESWASIERRNRRDANKFIAPSGVACPQDVARRIESYPIAGKMSAAIAERCAYYADPPAAHAALREQIDILDRMPASRRLEYFAATADLYLRVGDRDAAAEVIRRGFSFARASYEQDEQEASSEMFTGAGLLKTPKGVWPSAEAYRSMIALGVNVSVDATRKEIDKIPNADLRELEKVMVARALLGVPVRRYLVASSGSLCTISPEDTTYEQP